MSEVERYKAQLQEGYSVLLSYPTQALITAYGRSILQFFTAGGSGRWHSLLIENPEFLAEIWFKSKQSDVSDMLKKAFGSASPSARIISAVCLVFVIVARAIGLIGLISITPRRYWSLLLVLCSVIAYFALVHLFVGNSRYRISIEPALMLLFLFGIDSVWRRWRSRNIDANASPS